ncbi:hypothetical protein ACFSQP_08435 [Bizionia sediminis]|uniref:Glycine dehydrogenase n=1 Tax=Bizionia sediminis TaxID=1737064 RepID=A0ABW5KWD4_9FLAO
MKKRFLFISCEEAQHICDKAQYNEASGYEKFKLKLRLAWCRFTRAYVQRNLKLTHTIKSGNVRCLSKSERSQIKTEFNKVLSKHEH